MSAVSGRFLFICGALLLFANVACGDGTYQRTQNGKTFVWNSDPKPNDEATWSGDRDREGYARGFGTLTWHTARRKSEAGSAKSGLYARYWGNMVRGKFNGPVNVHSKGKTGHAIFDDGVRTTRWSAGPAPSWRVAQQRSKLTKREAAAEPAVTPPPELHATMAITRLPNAPAWRSRKRRQKDRPQSRGQRSEARCQR